MHIKWSLIKNNSLSLGIQHKVEMLLIQEECSLCTFSMKMFSLVSVLTINIYLLNFSFLSEILGLNYTQSFSLTCVWLPRHSDVNLCSGCDEGYTDLVFARR